MTTNITKNNSVLKDIYEKNQLSHFGKEANFISL